jgi:hypothetical protein
VQPGFQVRSSTTHFAYLKTITSISKHINVEAKEDEMRRDSRVQGREKECIRVLVERPGGEMPSAGGWC